ncbi:MAG: hypothetical protein IT328_05995 [Caldilineaceae bacterium]|nr:hypothetical protein [Caldilineaceae bacterium]
MNDAHPLPVALAMAVPIQINELAARGGPSDTEWELARQWADTLAERGDVLLYGGKKGEAATLFGEFANAVAVLAFAPGGIRIFGQHFDAQERKRTVADQASDGLRPANNKADMPNYQWMTYDSEAGIPGVPVEVKGEHVFIPGDEHPYPFNLLAANGNAKLTPLVAMTPERVTALRWAENYLHAAFREDLGDLLTDGPVAQQLDILRAMLTELEARGS